MDWFRDANERYVEWMLEYRSTFCNFGIMAGKGVFHFKQFDIDDKGAGMPINTDGVLLGAWALQGHDASLSRILDVGCGSGLLSLMLAQRFGGTRITGLDIDPLAGDLAVKNFAASPWSERLDAVCCDFNEWNTNGLFDVIVSNPPYFDSGELSQDSLRATARHACSLPTHDLISRSASLLTTGGRLCLVLPSSKTHDVIFSAAMNHLDLERVTRVCTVKGQQPVRVLLQFVKGLSLYIDDRELSIRDKKGIFTPEYRELTAPFYLDM